jgi:hypothetical protein
MSIDGARYISYYVPLTKPDVSCLYVLLLWCKGFQGGLVSAVLFGLYVNDMPESSRYVELALYADDTALIATSRSALLLISYLETYLNKLDLWLRDWRIAINVSKSTAVLFAKTKRCIQRPRPVQLFGEPIQLVDTARYLGVTLDTRLIWSAHVNQVGRKVAQRLGVLGQGQRIFPLASASRPALGPTQPPVQ